MNAANMACVILASGESQRFGEMDKLSADLNGKSVLSYAIDTAVSLDFGTIYCVSKINRDARTSWVKNENSDYGQGHALRLGLRAVRASGWSSCLLMLGDMPLVTMMHLKKMIKKYDEKQSIVSLFESIRMPPVLFNYAAMDMILERPLADGARDLFDKIKPLTMSSNAKDAMDIDTPEDLAKVATILKSRKV